MLERDELLTFPGFHGTTGVCHARVYRPGADTAPAVVVGALTDAPGTSITNAIEGIAGEIQHELIGSPKFRLVEYWPRTQDDPHSPGGEFSLVTFAAGDPGPLGGQVTVWVQGEFPPRRIGPERRPRGKFSIPAWRYLPREELHEIVGGPVETWDPDEYTLSGLFANRLASGAVEQIKTGNTRALDDFTALAREWSP